MSRPVIEVSGLGKRYRIYHRRRADDGLRHVITDWLTRPFRRGLDDAGVEEFWALRDVSFEVQEGEVLGIIGRNGAGKSTLLKLLSRITEPTTGEARIRGRVASLLEVGSGFHPELTGRENIFMNGAILGMSRREIEAKFDEIVAFAEVEQFLDTPVKRYSSGMHVRLGFAVAAHLEPEILIIDEVLAVGDAAFQRKCLGKMGEAASGGRTVLFVSHNMGAVAKLCTQCMLLEKGCVTRQGDTETVTGYYLGTAAGGEESLRSRTDRSGSGDVRVVDCAFHREANKPAVTEVFFGDPLRIELALESRAPIRVWVGIAVNGVLGQRLLYAGNRIAGLPPVRVDGTANVTLLFPHVWLTDGRYAIDIQIVAAEGLSVCDMVYGAARFSVLARDVHGSGFPVTAHFGQVHLPFEFSSSDSGAPSKGESANAAR